MTPETALPPATSTAPAASRGKLLLSKRELCDETGLTPRSVERMTANGTIPALRLTSRLLRYELPAVMAALRRFETATLTRKK